jgi:prepilin peptidase CpaA
MIFVGLAVLSFAALHDLAFRTIPNWVPITLVLLGVLLRTASGSLLFGLLGCLAVFLAAAFCWRRGWLGGGDVKLLGACTMLVPPSQAVDLLLSVALAGGGLAVLYMLLARSLPLLVTSRPSGILRRICRVERYRMQRRSSLPYASAIAAGVLFVLLEG